ncbi:peptidase S8 [Bergeyella porcorum]|uniref:Peptidase S8 n=1 Tax=Bergeyella porcorum TaxID=1735111 RepID=A0AAU0F0C3_9FLAO
MKIDIYKRNLMRRQLPIALCYLASTFVFAQEGNEVKAMKMKTDVMSLDNFGKKKRNQVMSILELEETAKSRKIPFEGKIEGRYYQLQGFSPKNGKPVYYITYNTGAALGTSVQPLHHLGGGRSLEGKGIVLHEWDAGAVRDTHQEFGGRVKQQDGATRYDEHATHVGGTMVASGVDGKAKGMAPKVNLRAYDWRDDVSEMVNAALDGALVSNHSYGVPGGFQWGDYSGRLGWHWFASDDETEDKRYGQYGETDAEWDFIALKAPYYLPVKAAANDRGGGPESGGLHFFHNGMTWEASTKERIKNGGELGYDCIPSGNLGKNSLIVGAIHKLKKDYETASDIELAEFSSTGPTDDGRIKPDIVGVGVEVYSTASVGNGYYSTLSGTSMATPNVSGALGLLQEHYKKLYGTEEAPFMKAATLKALVIHTSNEAGKHLGPDYQYGWGVLNASKAVSVLSDRNKYTLLEEKELENGTPYTLEVTAKGNEPLKITIVWDDAVPELLPDSAILNNRTPTLVNDLDIRVSDANGIYLPWVLNPDEPNKAADRGDNYRDNVEQILIENPIAGQKYTITVSHKAGKNLKTNQMINGQLKLVDAASQPFALVVSGIDGGVTKDLEIKAINIPEAKNFSSNTPVEIVVANVAEQVVSGAKITYRLVDVDHSERVLKEGELALGEMAKGQEIKKNIELDLSIPFVNYNIEAKIISEQDQIRSNDQLSVEAYGVVSDLTNGHSQYHYSFENDWMKNGWKVEDTDVNGLGWRRYESEAAAKTGRSVMRNHSDMALNINDWLYSNPLKLKKGQAYKIIINAKKENDKIQDNVGVFVGEEPLSSSMVQLGDEATLSTEYKRFVFDFRPSKDGVFYVGLNQSTAIGEVAYSVIVDDVSVIPAGTVPFVDFSASDKNPNSYESVELISEVVESQSPILSYEWQFTSDKVSFVEGTKNTANPRVVFNEEGMYSVALKTVNDKGESINVKENFIKVANTAITADFTASSKNVYEDNIVRFTDVSKGNPLPNKWLWTVTPADGVEYLNGNNVQNPEIKFTKKGTYSVKLEAGYVHNGASISQHSVEQRNLLNVEEVYASVVNLEGTIMDTKGDVRLSWQRPRILPLYVEDFEGNGFSTDFNVMNDDDNERNWMVDTKASNAHTGSNSVYSEAFIDGKYKTVSNWMITGKMKKGGEILKFWQKNQFKERLDVYIVPMPSSGGLPTLEEVKMGQKIYTSTKANSRYTEVNVDISQYTASEHYIVFHHNTTAKDFGVKVHIDDIEVGYNEASEGKLKTSNKNVETMGVIDAARLVGYKVFRNGALLSEIDDINQVEYDDTVDKNNRYTYDVYAVYSNGKESEPVSVTIDITNLSTSDVKNEGLKIYPNPSDGRFVVEAGSGVTSLKAEVYDMSGKQIYKQDFRGNKADLNLTQYPKGVYILNLVDNNGKKQSAKLMIK